MQDHGCSRSVHLIQYFNNAESRHATLNRKMATRRDADDIISADGDTYTVDDTVISGKPKKGNPILNRIFLSCEDDARGSVHRAWAVTVLFMSLFLIFAWTEGMFDNCIGAEQRYCFVDLLSEVIALMNNSCDLLANICRSVKNSTGCERIDSTGNSRIFHCRASPCLDGPWNLCAQAIRHCICSRMLPWGNGDRFTTKSAAVCGIHQIWTRRSYRQQYFR